MRVTVVTQLLKLCHINRGVRFFETHFRFQGHDILQRHISRKWYEIELYNDSLIGSLT